MPECSSCHAPIVWGRTEAGKNMALDADPNPEGGWYLEGGRVRAAEGLEKVVLADDGEVFYETHWATCPSADAHRR